MYQSKIHIRNMTLFINVPKRAFLLCLFFWRERLTFAVLFVFFSVSFSFKYFPTSFILVDNVQCHLTTTNPNANDAETRKMFLTVYFFSAFFFFLGSRNQNDRLLFEMEVTYCDITTNYYFCSDWRYLNKGIFHHKNVKQKKEKYWSLNW